MQINDLPSTLLIEILVRLPCQSVLQCKCVCKDWCSLISDPSFTRSFVHHNHNFDHSQPLTLHYQLCYWLDDFEVTYNNTISEHPIVQCRNLRLDFLPCYQSKEPWAVGLVASHQDLMVCYDMSLLSSDQCVYYICNPLTKQWCALPPVHGCHIENVTTMGFTTYATDSNNPSTKHFKVVRIANVGLHFGTDINEMNTQIFCSESGKWSNSLLSFPWSLPRLWQFRVNALTLKRTLSWLINDEAILVYDTFSNQCWLIDLPIELKSESSYTYLGAYRGNIRVAAVTSLHLKGVLSVWELQDHDGSKWSLKFSVHLKDMTFMGGRNLSKFALSTIMVLAFHPYDAHVVYLRYHNHIVMCDMKNSILELVSKSEEDWPCIIKNHTAFPLLHPCWPSSLCSLSSSSDKA